MPKICKENRWPECHPTVPWAQTLCSAISEGGHRAEHAMFHKAVSFVAPNGDKVADNTHIIFRTPSNGKVSSLCNWFFDSYHLLYFSIQSDRWKRYLYQRMVYNYSLRILSSSALNSYLQSIRHFFFLASSSLKIKLCLALGWVVCHHCAPVHIEHLFQDAICSVNLQHDLLLGVLRRNRPVSAKKGLSQPNYKHLSCTRRLLTTFSMHTRFITTSTSYPPYLPSFDKYHSSTDR